MNHRIVRVKHQGAATWGQIIDDRVRVLPGAPFECPLEPGEDLGGIDEVQLLAPVAPSKILGVGANFTPSLDAARPEDPGLPIIFSKPPSSVIGPGTPIELPAMSKKVELEGEMAVVIGRRCRSISVDDAWSYVFGITAVNDVSARDVQLGEHQWTRGKGFDTFTPLGPWIVTGVGEAEAADIGVRCRLNGEICQDGRARQMIFSAPFLIAHLAEVMTLVPGDVILTGTPPGSRPIAAGDTVEVEVEHVGVLSNPVI